MEDNISFTNLETERFVLRQLTLQDADEIFSLRADEEVNKYLGRPAAISINDAIDHINKINAFEKKGSTFFWAINYKGHSKLIGTVLFWNINTETAVAEIGYELLPAYQGNGVMQEVLKRIIDYGFDALQLTKIEAHTVPENARSLKLLNKLGFYQVPNSTDPDGLDIYALDNPGSA